MDPFADANAYKDTHTDKYTHANVYAHTTPTVQVERR